MKHLFTSLFLLALLQEKSFSQKASLPLDSLAAAASRLPDDTAKIGRLTGLADAFSNVDLGKRVAFLQQAYALARRLGETARMPELETEIGRGMANMALPDSALVYFGLARAGFEKTGDQRGLAKVLSKIRWVHNYLGDYEKALDFAFQTLAIYEKTGDESGAAKANSYIGDVLYSQKKWQEAANYSQKAYDTQKRLGLRDDLAHSASGLGFAWLQIGDYEKALAFQDEGLAIRRQLNSSLDVASSLNARGNVLKYMKRYPEALADYREALELARQAGFEPMAQTCISNIGHVFSLMGRFREALPYHLDTRQRILKNREMMNAPENLMLLAEAYAGIGKFDSAWFFQKKCMEIGDSLLSGETSLQMSKLQTRYETAQREAKIAVQTEQLTKQRWTLWLGGGLLALMLVGGLLLFRLTRILRRRNEEKAFLIKEIHHRVKNNLQVLSSLLHLQSRQIHDEAALDAVREGQNRVDAMGLIHQKLYMGDRLASVEMGEYLHELGDTLLDSFGLRDGRVKINYRLDPLHLDVDTAIPLGLIINELVTNSLKYAFPGGRAGAVEISLWKADDGKLCLKVADDGVGKDGVSEKENSTSFGTSLVHMLSKKLNGKPEMVESGSGYETLIRFENFRMEH